MKESTEPKLSDTYSEDRLFHIFFWIVVVGSLLVFFWDIWSMPLLTRNEARRLVVLREMITNSSWLIPTMNGEIYLEKPPLFYWFGAIFGLLANSTSEWVLRLPSAICAMCLVWLLYFVLKKHIGRWAALFGVLILATSSFFTMHARLAELEMLLTFCVFSSLLLYFEYVKHGNRYRLYGAYALMGLAFLTKGPVALLFFLPPILCYGLLARSKYALKGLIDWRGWLLFSVIAFPWFIYVNAQLQGAPLFEVIMRETTTKVAGEDYESVFYYLGVTLGGFAPWILLLFWQPRMQFRKLFANDAGRFFGLAALVPLIIFSLFTFKKAKYILPIFPALAVWLGMALAYSLEKAKSRWRFAPIVLIAFSALLIVSFVGYYTVVQPRVMSHKYYHAFLSTKAKLNSMRGVAPVYFFYFHRGNIQEVYYFGRPIPVVQKAELGKMLEDGKPFMLLVPNNRMNEIIGSKFCQLGTLEPWGERNEVLHILSPAGSSACVSGLK